ncbi:hypothetical protein FRB91_004593 [Serendipita sp. 411]|nr:hypothetical protein FRB91_004593 [Serendipita sp. 411]
MPTVAPYGTWKSPIEADLITQKSIQLVDIIPDPITGELFHVEGRPSEGGRNVIVRSRTNEDIFGPGWNARSGVHEYGGAPATAYGGKIYFSEWKTRRIYMTDGSTEPIPVTQENPNLRYANIAVCPSSPHLLVAVQENHEKPAPNDVVNELVVINTQTQLVTSLVAGADFYSSPTFSPDGKHIAWLSWKHPDMPWEGSQIWVADAEVTDTSFQVLNAHLVDGEPDKISANEPLWINNDTLVYQCDASGYYNPCKYSISSQTCKKILREPIKDDFSESAWVFGMSRCTALDERTLLASPIHEGFSQLMIIDIETEETTIIDNSFTSIDFLRYLSPTSAVMSGLGDDNAVALIQVEFTDYKTTPTFTTIKETSNLVSTLPPGYISSGKPCSLKGGNLYAILNLPTNADFSGPSSEKPPAVVNIHGGPTGRTRPGLSWITQYFTSRGWAWIDVNYSGSSGYGRAYRERLRGKWGIAEVADAADVVKELGEQGVIDPKRVAIRGGSAGGYTVLMTLCTPETANVFAAGTSSYGVSDLAMLANDTHKFESQYLFKLVGGTPEEVPEIYAARSPVKHADEIRSPLLILQGSDDAVVPPNQAETILKIIKDQGGVVEYVLFEGEGHGWRKAENVKKALETECNFYERMFKLGAS